MLNDEQTSNRVGVERQSHSHLCFNQFTVDIPTLLHPPHGKNMPGIPVLGAMVLIYSSQDAGCIDYFPDLPSIHEGSKLPHFDLETAGLNIPYTYMVHLETTMERERERETWLIYSLLL